MENKTEYEGTNYTVEFLTGRPLRMTHKGKHWPITTQCIIKRGYLVIGVGEVVKHEKDPENPQYAKVYAAKKAFANAGHVLWPALRKKLWAQILQK